MLQRSLIPFCLNNDQNGQDLPVWLSDEVARINLRSGASKGSRYGARDIRSDFKQQGKVNGVARSSLNTHRAQFVPAGIADDAWDA